MAKVERLKEDIAELGMPVIFVVPHGRGKVIRIEPKDCFVNDAGFNFSDDSSDITVCLSPDEVELKEKYVDGYKRCYCVRQIRDENIVAEIFWPK